MTKLSHEQAVKVLKRYARELVKFRETGDVPGQMFIGILIPGGFGKIDDFADAMRALRKRPSRAKKQSENGEASR